MCGGGTTGPCTRAALRRAVEELSSAPGEAAELEHTLRPREAHEHLEQSALLRAAHHMRAARHHLLRLLTQRQHGGRLRRAPLLGERGVLRAAGDGAKARAAEAAAEARARDGVAGGETEQAVEQHGHPKHDPRAH